MWASCPCLAVLLLAALSGAVAQDDPISNIVSQALSAVTDLRSALTAEPSTTDASTSSTSSTSTSDGSTSTSASAQVTSTSSSAESSSDSSATPTSSSTTPSDESATSSEAPSETSEAAAAASSSPEAAGGDSKGKTLGIALGVSVGLLTLGILIGVLFCCWRRRRRRQRSKLAQNSQRSLSPEAVGSGHWRKEPISHSSSDTSPEHHSHTSPGHNPASGQNQTPHGAGALPMTESVINSHNGRHSLSGANSSVPHGGVTNLHPGATDGSAAAHHSTPHHSSHTPSSSHSASKSNVAAAGLGGAALGGLAAKHHHDKQKEVNPSHHHHHNDSERGILRKPVGGVKSSDADSRPHSHPGKPMASGAVGSGAGTSSGSSHGSGGPPPYDGNSSPLRSHPPHGHQHRHSIGGKPAMAGAAGAAGAAAGSAAAGKHHGSHHESDPLLSDRHSADTDSQHQHHPPSILANVAGRRHIGSSNPYVSARSAGKTRFSDNVDIAEMPAHRGQDDDSATNQSGSHPETEHYQRPRPLNPSPERRFSSGSNPGHMPGSWRGSCDWDQNNRRGSFSHDDLADSKQRSQSFTDLRQQEEDAWYRGRQMSGGAGKPGFPHRPRYDSRFYAGKGVGQVM